MRNVLLAERKHHRRPGRDLKPFVRLIFLYKKGGSEEPPFRFDKLMFSLRNSYAHSHHKSEVDLDRRSLFRPAQRLGRHL